MHLQNAEAVQLMRDFLVDPQNHMEHPKRFSNSITNSLGKLSLALSPDKQDHLASTTVLTWPMN